MKRKPFYLIAIALLITACASVGDSIGGAYVSIETIAETVQMECGNVNPGDECRAGSALNREDVDRIKAQLQSAKNATDEANRLYMAHDGTGALTKLELTQSLLAIIRSTLESKGIN